MKWMNRWRYIVTEIVFPAVDNITFNKSWAIVRALDRTGIEVKNEKKKKKKEKERSVKMKEKLLLFLAKMLRFGDLDETAFIRRTKFS